MFKNETTIDLLLFKHFKPKEIILAGYDDSTVYRHSADFPTLMREFQKAKQKIRESRI